MNVTNALFKKHHEGRFSLDTAVYYNCHPFYYPNQTDNSLSVSCVEEVDESGRVTQLVWELPQFQCVGKLQFFNDNYQTSLAYILFLLLISLRNLENF